MKLEDLKSFVNGLTSEDLKAMGLELKPKKNPKSNKAIYFGYAGAFGGAPTETSDSGSEGGDGGGGE